MLRDARLAFRERRMADAELQCRRVLRIHPVHCGALHLLGQLHSARGDHVEAIRVLGQSLAYCPDNLRAWVDLAAACHKAGQVDAAIAHLRHAIALRPSFFPGYAQLASLYHEAERIDEAAGLYRAWASRDPASAEVAHMAAATSGEAIPERCSVAFVQSHFDKLATSFDQRLVDDLGYTGHRLATAALARHAADAPWASVLDAGCGTGLCGPLLRPHCRHLVGLDLSEQMIAQARLRACYDELVIGELGAFMTSRPSAFDAIVSSDVLIYLGRLEEPIRAAHRALHRGAVLVVTFEALRGAGAEYQLQSSGRYAHRDGYIQRTLAEVGFELLQFDGASLRREYGREVQGFVVVARKTGEA